MAVSLSEEQRRKANELRDALANGEITHPTEFVDWETLTSGAYKRGSERKAVIDASKIKGPLSHSHSDRLEQRRAVNILTDLLDGNWELKGTKFPPVAVEIDGDYYIATDGLHRSMVHKYLGLDLYVELHEDSELS